jgi:hypothetical protein
MLFKKNKQPAGACSRTSKTRAEAAPEQVIAFLLLERNLLALLRPAEDHPRIQTQALRSPHCASPSSLQLVARHSRSGLARARTAGVSGADSALGRGLREALDFPPRAIYPHGLLPSAILALLTSSPQHSCGVCSLCASPMQKHSVAMSERSPQTQ